MNRVRNIRTGDPKIDKALNKLTIASGISKWCPVSGSKMDTKLHRSINSANAMCFGDLPHFSID
jgi:hypothetical protein